MRSPRFAWEGLPLPEVLPYRREHRLCRMLLSIGNFARWEGREWVVWRRGWIEENGKPARGFERAFIESDPLSAAGGNRTMVER
jgi:hypothetical protein